ncbi:MAG: hypothetical protein DYH12_04140 [Sorangiineae bacterium PRO1]|nr:hypothetical protein [Sorangiineae bacterium PRO1]
MVVTHDPAHCGGCGRACPIGFDCQDSLCICDSNTDCGPGGTCEVGKCRCAGVLCGPGKRCVLNGGCG